jgi:tetratricopeptide (TPR) repeat protein
MAEFSFIVEIKRRLPENSWSWLISALRQDPNIWKSMQGKLGESALEKFSDRPQAYSPANLSLLALGYSDPEEIIRNAAYNQVPEPVFNDLPGSSVQVFPPELSESCLQAINLREAYLNAGSWQEIQLNPQTASPTTLSCLYGVLPDPLPLLAHLTGLGRADLALHAFLSNPIPPKQQAEKLAQLASSLPLDQTVHIIRMFYAVRPALAVGMAQELLKNSQYDRSAASADYLLNGPGVYDYFVKINTQLFQAELFRLAAQANLAVPIINESIQNTRQLQALLAARLAQAAEEENDRKASIAAWEQATRLDPEDLNHLGGLLLSLLDDNRTQDAQIELNEHPFIPKSPTRLPVAIDYAHARISLNAGDRMLARKQGLQALDNLMQIWGNKQVRQPTDIRLPIDIARLLLEVSLPRQASIAAGLILDLQPCNLDAILLSCQAELASGQLDAAIDTAHLAVGLAPDRLDVRRYLAQILESANEWIAAYAERAVLIERIAHPTADDWHRLAKSAIRAGDPGRSIQICEQILSSLPDDGIAHAILGEALAAQGNVELALERLNQAIQILPDHPSPWLALASLHRENGDREKALELLRAASQAAPDQPEILLALGEALLAESSPTQALHTLRRAYGVLNEYSVEQTDQVLLNQVALRLGQTYSQLGLVEDARQVLEPAYQIAPYHQEIAAQYAHVLMALEDYLPALAPLQTVLQSRPDSAQIYLDYARCVVNSDCYVDAEHYERALFYIDRSMEIDPDNPEARALSAEILSANGDLIPAANAYRKALDTRLADDPAWKVRLWLGLGKVALDLGQVETAVASLQEASQAGPLNPDVHRFLCEAYDIAGLIENAYEAAQTALNLAPADPDLLIWFAQKAEDLQAHPGVNLSQAHGEATLALEKVSRFIPDEGIKLVRLGKAQVHIGEHEAARRTFCRLVGQHEGVPGYTVDATPSDLFQAAEGLSSLGDPTNAAACLERALQIIQPTQPHLACSGSDHPDRSVLLSRLADAYQAGGQYQKALQVIEQALLLDPQNTDLYIRRADILLTPAAGETTEEIRSSGKGEMALDALETALQIEPKNPGLHLRAANVSRLLGNLPDAREHAIQAVEIFTHTTTLLPDHTYTPLAATILTADIARAMLQIDEAETTLSQCFEQTALSSVEDNLEFHCLSAEIALDKDHLNAATQHITKAIEYAADDSGLLALQARLSLRKGELPTSGEIDARSPAHDIFQLAQERYHKEILSQSAASADPGRVKTNSSYSCALRRLATAALELRLWGAAQDFSRQYAEETQEPYAFLAYAKCIVLQAEYQRVCQECQIVSHAPGEAALSEEAFGNLSYAIQNAEGRILEWEASLPADCSESQWQHHPYCLIKYWQDRGVAVLCPNAHSVEAMLALPATPENTIAQIAVLSRVGDLPGCGKVASLYPRNPFVLVQLAQALSDSLPKQALSAAHAAVELLNSASGEAKDELFSGEAVIRKNDAAIIYSLLAQLIYRYGAEPEERAMALQSLHKALNLWKDEPHWHILAADLYRGLLNLSETERSEKVILHLEEAVRYAPDNVTAHLYLGQELLRKGNIQPAVDVLENANILAPQDVKIMTLLAQAHIASGNFSAAEEWIDQAMQVSPEEIEPILLRGQLYLDNMNPIAAQQCAQRTLELEPENPTALLLLSHVYKALNQPEQAVELLESALPSLEFDLPLQLEYINILQQTRGSKSALEAARQLAQRLPTDPLVLSQLARSLADDGQIDDAVQTAQRALRCNNCTEPLSDSKLAWLHYQLGSLLSQAGQLDQSIHHLVEAVHINPNYIEPYLELGRVHQQRRQHAQAMSAFNQAITAAPNDARPYYQAGMALKENKDYLEAERMLRRACELAPDDVSIHRLLGAVVTLNLVHNQQPGSKR